MRILFIASRPPWPSRRGDQARLAGWVSELGPRHEIAVVAQRPPGFPETRWPPAVRGRSVPLGRGRILLSLCRRLNLPLQVAWHHQPLLTGVVRREIDAFRPDVAVVMLSRLGWLLPAIGVPAAGVPAAGVPAAGVPVVVDLVDSLALNMRRRAERQPLLSALWRWESRRIEAWERQVAGRVACATVVSERDRRALTGGPESGRVEVVPFGIPLPGGDPPPRDEPILVLSGNLGYFPTREGALWLAREVWPRVLRACPEARWWLAGSRVPPSLRRLERLPGVEVLADPQDLSDLRRRAAVAVAPMRAGSGTPIKVLEAMADGLPVVATPEAAAGLDGLAGGELTVAGDPEAFAAALTRLLTSPEAAREQAASAHRWLRGRHDLSRVAERFEHLLEEAAGSQGGGRRIPQAPN